MRNRPAIIVPEGLMEEEAGKVLLHACCAPCSSAIVEWMLANGVRPTIFYYNPNIFPREEYEIRKQERSGRRTRTRSPLRTVLYSAINRFCKEST